MCQLRDRIYLVFIFSLFAFFCSWWGGSFMKYKRKSIFQTQCPILAIIDCYRKPYNYEICTFSVIFIDSFELYHPIILQWRGDILWRVVTHQKNLLLVLRFLNWACLLYLIKTIPAILLLLLWYHTGPFFPRDKHVNFTKFHLVVYCKIFHSHYNIFFNIYQSTIVPIFSFLLMMPLNTSCKLICCKLGRRSILRVTCVTQTTTN